jgi:F-type H+-transporting ATPase subunit b
MISVDVSLFIQIANFLFLIWVLNIILYRPIRGIIRQRKEKFEKLEQGITSSHQDAEEKKASFALGIKEARARGMKEKEAMVEAAQEEEKKILDKLNRKAQADLAQMREKVSQEAETVRKTLEKEVDSFAEAISYKILGRAVQ